MRAHSGYGNRTMTKLAGDNAPIPRILLLALFAALAACDAPDTAMEPEPSAATDSSAGVSHRILRKGYGRAAEPGDRLLVHTTGWLYDASAPDKRGEKFWSSLDSGEKLPFILGAGRVIKGWDQGLPGMLIGEVRELTIPPELAYGSAGRDPIPPNATLVFEVELFDAESPEEVAGD